MSQIKMSLINHDYKVQAAAAIDFNDTQNTTFSDFIDHLKENLVTGDTAWLQIEGLDQPVKLMVAESA